LGHKKLDGLTEQLLSPFVVVAQIPLWASVPEINTPPDTIVTTEPASAH